jgi:hypothetical protein
MEVAQGDSLSYQQMIDYLSTYDLTTDAAYAYLDSVIDLDECILYFAAQAYYDNMDWPGTNIKFWRERSASGKWRWILFGLDFGFGLYAHGPSEDHIAFMFSTVETRYSNPPWATLLQRKLIENPTIRNRFINQIADLLNTNFKSERVVSVINTLANHISNEISRHRSRWGLQGENLNKMTTFAQQRPAFLRDHVRNYFKCGSNGAIIINATEGGSVQLNTLTLQAADMPFNGIYFSDNEVHLKAIPDSGYKFDGWSGAVSTGDIAIDILVTGSTNLTASFSIDSSLTTVEENEDSRFPREFSLSQNYPNPFNPTTTFEFQIAEFPENGTGGLVVLKVFDVLGKEVATIVNEELPTGMYSRQWKAVGLTSGVYFYQLRANSFVDTKKLILMK